jgi:hypothetical protein
MSAPSSLSSPGVEGVRTIPTASIRTDGHTQHRYAINLEIVAEYTQLMRDAVIFPPIRLWWDGTDYWLADGFHRLAAAEMALLSDIKAEVRSGSVSDAQWDSYAANAVHGLRWTLSERQQVLQRALAHTNATQLSNVQLAAHLHVSEKTIRRWRKTASSACAEDKIRLVTRNGTTYPLAIQQIGRAGSRRRLKSRREVQAQLSSMKTQASPKVRRLLNIIANWVFGSATAGQCLDAIERGFGDSTK